VSFHTAATHSETFIRGTSVLSQSLDPQFDPLLDDFERKAIGNSDDVIYGMWPDLTLAYLNCGWTRFAESNCGQPEIQTAWTLGRCILEAIAAPLHSFFVTNYAKCLEERRPWEHTYECSSATEYRTFHMLAFPLGKSEGLLVVNSLRLASEHTRTSLAAMEADYRDEHGILSQCCHCRRVRRRGAEERWDWAPQWVDRQPSRTSHSICQACFGFYYSPLRDSRQGHPAVFQTAS
jgi:hypothetical protein